MVCNTLLGLWLIDRAGRRTLLFIGSYGYIFSLGLVARAFSTEHFAIIPAGIFHRCPRGRVGCGDLGADFGDLPGQASSRGPDAGKLHALDLRSSHYHLLPQGHRSVSPETIFLFFCGMIVLQLIWVKTMVVETKGVTLEKIQKQLGMG